MEFRGPKSLDKLCSRVIVKNLLQFLEKDLSNSESLTREQIVLKFQDGVIPKLQAWRSCLPLSNFSIRKNLQEALDDLTEVDPRLEIIGHPVNRLFHFVMKILNLEEIFLDRNYSKVIEGSEESLEDTVDDESSDDEYSFDDSDSFVSDNDIDFPDTDDESLDDSEDSITLLPDCDERMLKAADTEDVSSNFLPYCLSSTAISVIKSCQEFSLTKLTIYGYFNFYVIDALLERCPHLEILSVSGINLYGSVMVSIGNNCPKLRNLKLVGCFASKTSCTKGFFKNATITSVRNAFANGESVPLSFPNLRVLDLGFRGVWSIKSFEVKKWILFYYKSLALFNFDYIFDCAVNPMRLAKMNESRLNLLRINYKFIYKLSSDNLDQLLKSLPKLRILEINLSQDFTESEQLKAEENLQRIASDNKLLKYALDYIINYESRLRVVNPMLNIIGANVNSISIEIHWEVKVSLFYLLKNIFLNCPSMEILKLLLMTTNSIADESIQNKNFGFQHNKLKELWLHEEEPWIFPTRPSSDDPMSNLWSGVLNLLQRSLPELSILSLTVWNKVSESLEHLASDVTTFHLKHSPYRDDVITAEEIHKVVRRFPYMDSLYLEGIEWKVFWKVKNDLQNTNIKVSWGSLDGWPDCNWPCGFGGKTSAEIY